MAVCAGRAQAGFSVKFPGPCARPPDTCIRRRVEQHDGVFTGRILLSRTSFSVATRPAPPSGAAKNPLHAASPGTLRASRRQSRPQPRRRWRRGLRESEIASGFGTRSPEARVEALSKNSELSRCCSNALTMGARQPRPGRKSCAALVADDGPMASSSSNAFHMPISPTPPPVG